MFITVLRSLKGSVRNAQEQTVTLRNIVPIHVETNTDVEIQGKYVFVMAIVDTAVSINVSKKIINFIL